ncbi:hypothetical protein [Alkaliphilus oremlandii]|uniref:Uncharacterized protein n=1 Tax=Alkaliphilus oremlandii (strain OhILAs) TaxID=350688 RepID=A8MJ28_ALKOO|nr:hypothetical protein [Alkaliphilus oremlandii]ABW19810.1 conserved hypothetical protein [Alkaliphilus oremlandii OhILAs]
MFFKKAASINFANKVMKKNRIPILLYNKHWRSLYNNNMNKSMENLSKELEKLLIEQKQAQDKLRVNKEKKRVLMNKIIHLSDLLNSKGEEVQVSSIEDAKNEINALNEEIDQLLEELEIYPEKIEHVNLELLKATAKVSYAEINTTQSRLKTVDEEIERLREKLGEYRDEKESLEKKVQVIYSLLHSIIGPDEIEQLDIKFFED